MRTRYASNRQLRGKKMINREDIKYIKNILGLHNNNVDLDPVYQLITSFNEGNTLQFYSNLLTMKDDLDIKYLINVLTAIKDNKDLERDIFDSFSPNQVSSKKALLDAVSRLDILNKDSTVVIWGCWYGSILIPALSDKVKKIIGVDLDENAIKIAKNKLFPNIKNVEFIVDDIFASYKKSYIDTNLFVNTSCEHMRPMKEWKWFDSGALENDNVDWKTFRTPKLSNNSYFAFQSNNMYGIEGHINCVNSLDEFKNQLPERAEVLHQEEVEDARGTRYMLTGKFNPL